MGTRVACVCERVWDGGRGWGVGVVRMYVCMSLSCFPCCRNHVYLWYCSRSGLDALTSFASLRKKIGWWGSSLVFLFLFLLLVSSGSSSLPVRQLFLVFLGPFFFVLLLPEVTSAAVCMYARTCLYLVTINQKRRMMHKQ